MRPVSETHKNQLALLESGTYEGLRIVRIDRLCSLIIKSNGEEHCFVSRAGKRLDYRHAWQIREWLEKKFGIETEKVPVTTFKYGGET